MKYESINLKISPDISKGPKEIFTMNEKSFVDQEQEKKDFELYSKQVNSFLDTTLNHHKGISSEQLEPLKQWMANNLSPEKKGEIENIIVNKIKEVGEINSETLLFLNTIFSGDFYEYQNVGFLIAHDKNIEKTTIKQLEDYFISDEEKLMEIIDTLKKFITQYGITRFSVRDRDKTEEELIDEYRNEYEDVEEDLGSFQFDVYLYFEKNKHKFDNYLVQKNIEDLLSHYYYDYKFEDIYKDYYDHIKKDNSEANELEFNEDTSGITYGDEALYVGKHAKESYENRKILGINQGNFFSNPVLQVAPNYYGYYDNGKIEQIYFYEKNQNRKNDFEEMTKKYDAENREDVQEVYNLIKRYKINKDSYINDNDFETFEEEFDFLIKSLKLKDNSFYIDFSKIKNIETIHPIIINILLYHNDEYFKTKKIPCVAEKLSQEEFVVKVFPYNLNKEKQEKQINQYLNLTKLHMRQKVHMDFGIELSNYDFELQRNFLNFLSTRSVENVDKLISFVHQFGDVGLKTFLSLDSDEKIGDKILSISNNLKDNPEIANQIFTTYADIVDKVLIIKNEIESFLDNGNKLSQKDIQNIEQDILESGKNELIKFADLLQENEVNKKNLELVTSELNNINANVILISKIVKQLPREDVSKLDLKKISHIEKLENITGAELINKPEIMDQIKQIINSEFPKGDSEIFEKECQTNPNFKLTITLANNKVLSFFSKENKSKNIEYVDWFISNPDALIKGLGQATLKLGFDNKEEEKKSYYAVAKPHAKSFQVLVENLNFVSFDGSTKDGEYKHHYARIRRLPSDQEFKSKNLSLENNKLLLEMLNNVCLEEKMIKSFIFEGKKMSACKTQYHQQNHHDDITEKDADGWIMAEISKQNNQGKVLTRFIPQNLTKNNQVFYAVFEEDSASDDLTEELLSVVSPDPSNSHSISKKALSN